MQSGFDINQLTQEAQSRWLKPAEVLFILQNHANLQITEEAPQKPSSGSLFLFNKRVLRFFRKDGHNWRKKKDGRTVGEAHERLKVGNAEALNCYYAHGEDNPSFQRRSYWMLDPASEHIVLVHYREITEGKLSSGSPAPSTTFSQSSSAYTVQNPGSTRLSDFRESYQSHASPGSIEVSSDVTTGKQIECLDEPSLSLALRRLEAQLSLDDDNLKDYAPLDDLVGNEDECGISDHQSSNKYPEMASYSNGPSTKGPQLNSGGNKANDSSFLGMEQRISNGESVLWKPDFDISRDSQSILAERDNGYSHNANGRILNFAGKEIYQAQCFKSNIADKWAKEATDLSGLQSQMYSATPESPSMLLDPSLEMPLGLGANLTVAKDQCFTIREISPQWGFANDSTKVIIVGSFLCSPSNYVWHCMFGDVEVPLQIIQDGVLCCQSPPQPSGKVTLCVTSGNRESCSEIREFEYREKYNSCAQCDKTNEETRSTEEMLLLVRLVQLLLSDSPVANRHNKNLEDDQLRKEKSEDDSWDQIIEALLVGAVTSSATLDWVLEQLLKDKLLKWLSSRSMHGAECKLSRKEQGLIHLIAGLGYEWALSPLLDCGVGVNFRDINGWTALHWAAKFGREKMVAALIATGASAVAVTDPSSYDPTGRNAAYIAATNGHKGLAGYLSEKALTSHLSSLTLGESELSKGSADLEAEITVNNILRDKYASPEDQLSLKHTLAAVRNAAQAAARIQSAFRAHSFRKRQQKEEASSAVSTFVDEYGLTYSDMQELAAASKLMFHNSADHDKAALSIQKNYRGWKGRKDFLTLRQKVVKIQAHVRGYQVRKKYKVICWAVGILDKAVLRWRRKGAGLRGFKHEPETIDDDDNEGEEDIVKIFRKEKVNVAIDEAVSTVLSMVESPEARKQYHRMLGKVLEAKAERQGHKSPQELDSGGGVSNMDNDDFLKFP